MYVIANTPDLIKIYTVFIGLLVHPNTPAESTRMNDAGTLAVFEFSPTEDQQEALRIMGFTLSDDAQYVAAVLNGVASPASQPEAEGGQ